MITRFGSCRRAATSIEYAVIITLLGLAVFGFGAAFEGALTAALGSLSGAINDRATPPVP